MRNDSSTSSVRCVVAGKSVYGTKIYTEVITLDDHVQSGSGSEREGEGSIWKDGSENKGTFKATLVYEMVEWSFSLGLANDTWVPSSLYLSTIAQEDVSFGPPSEVYGTNYTSFWVL